MNSRSHESDFGMASSTDHKLADMNTQTIEAIAVDEAHSGGRDKAAQMLKEAGHSVIVTPEDNKRILRKIDRAILPIILVIYCLQSLDKTALSYASVFGLIKDTDLKGLEYSWLGSKVLHSYQIIFLVPGCLTVAFSAVVFIFLPDSPMQARFLTVDDKLIAIERLRMNQQAHNRGLLLFAYYILSVYPANSPLIYSWSGQNTAGDTKRKVTTGMLFVRLMSLPLMRCPQADTIHPGQIGASVGNIIGPNLYKPSEAPHYTRGLRSNLALFCVIIVLVGLGVAWIRVLNRYVRNSFRLRLVLRVQLADLPTHQHRRHAAQRISLGKAGKVIDLSMENNKTLAKEGEAVNGNQRVGGIGDKAFDDVTDLRNEDFIYVY
ncbi:hypothetical protein B0A54_15374 [Friedmanniomyces endolithicus]|uniref:Uncharacterized protein n=1 Tax=Friedmanniomyces endolithicus TaxID=329885 RepID=A0A4U0U778_9PEZI|nr:hypothetical protein B0A54_15374 [Friedmanniomyces endolithicus]